MAPSAQPGQVIIYHAWENFQFARHKGQQEPIAGSWKALHLVGDYGQLHYRALYGAPNFGPPCGERGRAEGVMPAPNRHKGELTRTRIAVALLPMRERRRFPGWDDPAECMLPSRRDRPRGVRRVQAVHPRLSGQCSRSLRREWTQEGPGESEPTRLHQLQQLPRHLRERRHHRHAGQRLRRVLPAARARCVLDAAQVLSVTRPRLRRKHVGAAPMSKSSLGAEPVH